MHGIPVLFSDNHYKVVSGIELDQLLMLDRVKAFRRSTGWVIIGEDPLRGAGGEYSGPERRRKIGRICGTGSRIVSQQTLVQKTRLCLTCVNLVDGKCLGKILPGSSEEC